MPLQYDRLNAKLREMWTKPYKEWEENKLKSNTKRRNNVIKELLCRVFGHKWRYVGASTHAADNTVFICKRCNSMIVISTNSKPGSIIKLP